MVVELTKASLYNGRLSGEADGDQDGGALVEAMAKDVQVTSISSTDSPTCPHSHRPLIQPVQYVMLICSLIKRFCAFCPIQIWDTFFFSFRRR